MKDTAKVPSHNSVPWGTEFVNEVHKLGLSVKEYRQLHAHTHSPKASKAKKAEAKRATQATHKILNDAGWDGSENHDGRKVFLALAK